MPELLVTLCIFSILVVVGVNSHIATMTSMDRGHAREQIAHSIERLKQEALSEGARTILTIEPGGNSYTLGIDYPPYNDPVAEDDSFTREELPTGVSLTTSQAVMFDSRGFLIASDGVVTSTIVNLGYDATTFCSITIFSTGGLSYSC